MNQKSIDHLKLDEGESLTIYKCTGDVWTIGRGRNLERGITKEESNYLFMNDLKRVQEELSSSFNWFYMLNDVRQGALINMAFNLGITRFKKFKKMIAALERKDYKEASIEMLDSKWANQVGDRAVRLSKQMLTGKF